MSKTIFNESIKNYLLELSGIKRVSEHTLIAYKKDLKAHYAATHVKELSKCDKCNKSFAYAQNLLRHKKTYHPEGSPSEFKCNIDGMTFKYKSCLNRHMKSVHA